jgi:uncharacterized protein
MSYQIIRDPLWNNIRVDPLAMRMVDSRAFQRLRYVRQLGLAHLVYPGATHSRFEHALGAHHLAKRTLGLLDERGQLTGIDEAERATVVIAALLHDIGHYPFSHALEEIGVLHHEEVARPLLMEGTIADVLVQALGRSAPQQVFDLIRGRSMNPLQGLISGSLDLDKIEYLKRDALMCGVPYGEIDVDRLLDSLQMVDDPETGRRAVGVLEKGLSAMESLLFAKYQMYRNVYWHHAVRSATAMYKRLVDDALRSGKVAAEDLTSFTDEGLLHHLDERAPSSLLDALRERRLYKRIIEVPAAELPEGAGEWIVDDREMVVAVENALATELGVEAGSLLLDYPVKTQMMGVDVPVLRRSGQVQRIAPSGWAGAIDLPALSEQLYRSARWLRVFSATPLAPSVRDRLLKLLQGPEEAVRRECFR